MQRVEILTAFDLSNYLITSLIHTMCHYQIFLKKFQQSLNYMFFFRNVETIVDKAT